MLIGPMLAGDNPEKVMVEPPGIAPGSNPLIARAFISIVGASPDPANIGAKGYWFQSRLEKGGPNALKQPVRAVAQKKT
jgi:hypothetical protein